MEKIPIYIGTEPAQRIPTKVLKFSIKRRTEADVEFRELEGLDFQLQNAMHTGFSFYRFCIPELCHYQGKALYLDADMIVVADIAELCHLDMGGKPALARPYPDGRAYYTSCMVLDCEKLQHWKTKEWVALINAGLVSYNATMHGARGGTNQQDFAPLPKEWNDMDSFDAKTKIIHYTHVGRQPWKKAGHPHRGVFLKELHAALDAGVVKYEEIQEEIGAKHLYPEILSDMEAFVAEL